MDILWGIGLGARRHPSGTWDGAENGSLLRSSAWGPVMSLCKTPVYVCVFEASYSMSINLSYITAFSRCRSE